MHVSPPLSGPLTFTSEPSLFSVIVVEAPSVSIALSNGSNGLLASITLARSVVLADDVPAMAVRNLRVAPDSPQSIGVVHETNFLVPQDTIRLFSVRALAPRDRIASRVLRVSSHSETPWMTVSPCESREASSAL